VQLNSDNGYYLQLFGQVSRLRPQGAGFGLEPLQPQSIAEWSKYSGRILDSFERALLLDMDETFRTAWREENDRIQERIKAKAKGVKDYR
jgi:hypothetical protein